MERTQFDRQTDRKIYLDFLRVFATFAVMILHISAQNWHSTDVNGFEWQVFNFFDSIVRWGVPVFVMISGSLFLNRETPLRIIYSKYIRRMITAFIVWSAIYAFFQDGPIMSRVKALLSAICFLACRSDSSLQNRRFAAWFGKWPNPFRRKSSVSCAAGSSAMIRNHMAITRLRQARIKSSRYPPPLKKDIGTAYRMAAPQAPSVRYRKTGQPCGNCVRVQGRTALRLPPSFCRPVRSSGESMPIRQRRYVRRPPHSRGCRPR